MGMLHSSYSSKEDILQKKYTRMQENISTAIDFLSIQLWNTGVCKRVLVLKINKVIAIK